MILQSPDKVLGTMAFYLKLKSLPSAVLASSP